MQTLKGKVAVVTGASRGSGRGIARVLGEAGATVYVTGRSMRGGAGTDNRTETVDETAEQVSARGGLGIPVQCDQRDPVQVEALFARVKAEHGRLDLLVNNSWGGYEVAHSDVKFSAPCWEEPLGRWDQFITAGVYTHWLSSRFAAPLMVSQQQGLMVNVTFWDQNRFINGVLYDLAKVAINRLAYGLAQNLSPYHITAISLSPGWMRTEKVFENWPGSTEANFRDFPDLARTESVEYIGRAIWALATDSGVQRKSGETLTVGDLAREYGFTDIDGTQPPAFVIA